MRPGSPGPAAASIAGRRERLIEGLREIRDTLAREKALALDAVLA
jgi:hypothetical protein